MTIGTGANKIQTFLLLTPPGLAVRSSTTVVEFDGFKNCTSRDFDAFAESRCWAVRVTVVCKSSSKLSVRAKWKDWIWQQNSTYLTW